MQLRAEQVHGLISEGLSVECYALGAWRLAVFGMWCAPILRGPDGDRPVPYPDWPHEYLRNLATKARRIHVEAGKLIFVMGE